MTDIAARAPADLDTLGTISGIGAKKLESYGRAFLAVITGSEAPAH